MKEKAATFIQSCWSQVLTRKWLQKLKQEAYEISIILIGDSSTKREGMIQSNFFEVTLFGVA
jgi:hypothetical protein